MSYRLLGLALGPEPGYTAIMKHPIDPKIDCVFKALLGAEANRRLLIHFLNAVLGAALPGPVCQVDILNPYNEREFLDDKLSIVDVKARDDQGQLYQVEIQLLNQPDLPVRILYTWADLYSAQLSSGQDYNELRPTYAIWLLAENLLRGDPAYTHIYRLRDDAGRLLLDHGGIWLLELNKFAAERVETEQQRWLKFFQEGEHLDENHLPDWMQTDEMRQAMSTLKAFSEKERAYHAYQARQNYLHQQRSIQRYIETLQAQTQTLQAQTQTLQAQTQTLQAQTQTLQAQTQTLQAEKEQERTAKEAALQEKEAERQAKEAERQAKEAERQAKEAALAEIARLKALLRDS
ncbi:MAG: Rpn family recombination-promoting nuclease/putative transposase [Candidatus Competibacteraceae bacterium]